MVVSRWENELDTNRKARVLNSETEVEAEEPEAIVEGLLLPDGTEA